MAEKNVLPIDCGSPSGPAARIVKSKVVIGDLSPVQLPRVKRLLEAQPDMETAGPIESPIELLLAVKELAADAVILPVRQGGKTLGLCTHLLAEFPGLLVLAVAEDGAKAFMFDNRIAVQELAGTDEKLLETIRGVGAKEPRRFRYGSCA